MAAIIPRSWWQGRGVGDPINSIGVKRLSAFFELPYWQVQISSRYYFDTSLRHCITADVLRDMTDVSEDVSVDINDNK